MRGNKDKFNYLVISKFNEKTEIAYRERNYFIKNKNFISNKWFFKDPFLYLDQSWTILTKS